MPLLVLSMDLIQTHLLHLEPMRKGLSVQGSVTQCMREASCGNDNYVFTQMMRQQSGPASFTPSNSPNTFNPAMMLRQAAVTGVSVFTGAASAVTDAASAAISAAFSLKFHTIPSSYS